MGLFVPLKTHDFRKNKTLQDINKKPTSSPPQNEVPDPEDIVKLDTPALPDPPIEMISLREGLQMAGALLFVLILLFLTLYTTKYLGYF